MSDYVDSGYFDDGYADGSDGNEISESVKVYASVCSIGITLKQQTIKCGATVFSNYCQVFLHVNDSVAKNITRVQTAQTTIAITLNTSLAIIGTSCKVQCEAITITVTQNSASEIIGTGSEAECDISEIEIISNDVSVIAEKVLVDNDDGEVGVVTVDPNVNFYVGAITIRILPMYLSNLRNCYIYAKANEITLQMIDNPISSTIYADTTTIKISPCFSMAQMDYYRTVKKIGDFELDMALEYSISNFSDFTATKATAIDNSSVISVLKLGKFNKEIEIMGMMEISQNSNIVEYVKSIIEEEIEITFSDESKEIAKFNLLGNPISVNIISEGINYYDVTLRMVI